MYGRTGGSGEFGLDDKGPKGGAGLESRLNDTGIRTWGEE